MSKVENAVADLYAEMGRHRITAVALADRAGITRVSLGNWRNGRAIPSLSAWLDVQAALDEIVAERKKGSSNAAQ